MCPSVRVCTSADTYITTLCAKAGLRSHVQCGGSEYDFSEGSVYLKALNIISIQFLNPYSIHQIP